MKDRNDLEDGTRKVEAFLTHVPPAGFMRIRYYGFMGSGRPTTHKKLGALVRMAQGFELDPIEYAPEPDKPFRCPRCGAIMVATVMLDVHRQLVAVIRRRRPKRE